MELSLFSNKIAIEAQMEAFRNGLSRWSPVEMVSRFVTLGDPVVLSSNEHAELKIKISKHFDVHPTSVYVVGSAKLGFSIAPGKRWRVFGETSDIDVAIVSNVLYTNIWHEISSLLSRDPFIRWPKKAKYAEYQLHGWMRPDLLPTSQALQRAGNWFKFFRQLTAEGCCGPYKISAGLYYDMYFLEQYQARAVDSCAADEGGVEDGHRDHGNE
jgi:hypothetical protein